MNKQKSNMRLNEYKKPTIVGGQFQRFVRSFLNWLESLKQYGFCAYCGQRLDWRFRFSLIPTIVFNSNTERRELEFRGRKVRKIYNGVCCSVTWDGVVSKRSF